MRSESGSPVGEFEARRRARCTNLANSGTLRSSLTASGLHKPLLLLRAVRVLPRTLDIPGFHSARLKIFKLLNHFVAFLRSAYVGEFVNAGHRADFAPRSCLVSRATRPRNTGYSGRRQVRVTRAAGPARA